MSLVVDASVALKWVLAEEGSAAAEALLDETLIAPALWLVEAANALWRRNLKGELTARESEERLLALMDAPVRTLPVEDDLSAALRLASELRHPVYDCLYLAAALRHDTRVVTADVRFSAVAADLHPGRVRLL
ncbi:MAG TPA: type II toxin-antitoxin system VapC family toxin [Caulobacteraceae bacterium]|jgi:predicted nucleic acid-binding protein